MWLRGGAGGHRGHEDCSEDQFCSHVGGVMTKGQGKEEDISIVGISVAGDAQLEA